MDDSNEGDEWRPWIEICSPSCESPIVSEGFLPPPSAGWFHASPPNHNIVTPIFQDVQGNTDTSESYALSYAGSDGFEREIMTYFPRKSSSDQVLEDGLAKLPRTPDQDESHPRTEDRKITRSNRKTDFVDDLIRE